MARRTDLPTIVDPSQSTGAGNLRALTHRHQTATSVPTATAQPSATAPKWPVPPPTANATPKSHPFELQSTPKANPIDLLEDEIVETYQLIRRGTQPDCHSEFRIRRLRTSEFRIAQIGLHNLDFSNEPTCNLE